ncbi:MAG: methylmalonyl-CoA mutase [Deltaproteobacteria bacterium]|nr:methylmalonyl-CoA mutase [Deltaproteobacteria bacterium]
MTPVIGGARCSDDGVGVNRAAPTPEPTPPADAAGQTHSGVPVEPFYRPEDLAGSDYASRLGDPGAYPFARGVRPPSTVRRGWVQRELSGEGDPARSNAQLRQLLAHGQSGLDVIGDAPTMAWMDPDHALARHAIGTQGVSLCRLDDFDELYRGLPLGEITLSHSLPAPITVAALWCIARRRGVAPERLRGSVIQTPYFCEDTGYAVHMPFELRLRLAADSIAFSAETMPRFHAFLEDTYYISDGALDAVDEMAFGFVETRGLIRELLRRGVPVDRFAPRIAFLVNCRMDVFEEIAKIRATRRLHARMMRDEFGARDPRSLAVNVTVHTSGMSLTAQQPVNNIVRGAIQAFALALSGVQAIEVSAFDEAFRTPSPEAHAVALRTQQIVDLEARAGRVLDPLGGSWFVESLTDEIERRIESRVAQIEAMGDPAALVDGGWFRGVFRDAMEREARAVADGSLARVGVNCFQIPEEEDVLLREVVEGKIEPFRARIEEIRHHKSTRDALKTSESLSALGALAARRDANLMPGLVDALEAGATMGEIASSLRVAYGRPADPFSPGGRAVG